MFLLFATCITTTYHTTPRHRDEISKIPFYADSIMKMLKDIRRTVSASAKLHPGSNAFTQFLDEVNRLPAAAWYNLSALCMAAAIRTRVTCF